MLAVTLNGWLLSLHVLAAFALVGALTLFGMATVAARRIESPAAALALGRIVAAGTVFVTVGFFGTLGLGLWLALSIDRYSPWHGWIVASVVLWFGLGALHQRWSADYATAVKSMDLEAGLADEASETGGGAPATRLRPRSLALVLAGSAVAVVILALMIWKPGA